MVKVRLNRYCMFLYDKENMKKHNDGMFLLVQNSNMTLAHFYIPSCLLDLFINVIFFLSSMGRTVGGSVGRSGRLVGVCGHVTSTHSSLHMKSYNNISSYTEKREGGIFRWTSKHRPDLPSNWLSLQNMQLRQGYTFPFVWIFSYFFSTSHFFQKYLCEWEFDGCMRKNVMQRPVYLNGMDR